MLIQIKIRKTTIKKNVNMKMLIKILYNIYIFQDFIHL